VQQFRNSMVVQKVLKSTSRAHHFLAMFHAYFYKARHGRPYVGRPSDLTQLLASTTAESRNRPRIAGVGTDLQEGFPSEADAMQRERF